MKNIKQQIENLRHWASMAELTAEQVSCLTPNQLRQLSDSLEGLHAEAQKVQVYEKIYGPLRECPGEDSIYSEPPTGHGPSLHGLCCHLGCIPSYCSRGHLHLLDFDPSTGVHTHSFTGGKNDA